MGAVMSIADAEALPCKIRELGLVEYDTTWRAMRLFTESRTSATPDEIWLLNHKPVYTLGLAGRPSHIRGPATIPIVKSTAAAR